MEILKLIISFSLLTGSPARIVYFTHFNFYAPIFFPTILSEPNSVKKGYFKVYIILEFRFRHGISGCAAQERGKKAGQTGGDFHGELSNELFLMSLAGRAPQSIWSRYPECPSSDWSLEWRLFSPLSQ